MSADSTPPSSPEPASPMSGETPIETLPQKRRYKRPDGGDAVPASAAGGDADNEIIVLSSLLQSLLARKEGGETTETEARGKINRFVSRKDAPAGPVPPTAPSPVAPAAPGTPAPPAAKVVAPADEAVSAPRTPPGAGPEGMAAIAFPKFEARSFQSEPPHAWGDRSGSMWGRGVLYFAFAAGIALLAFLAGRSQPGRVPVAPGAKVGAAESVAVWEPAMLEQLEKALVAEQSGDVAAARKIIDNLQRGAPGNAALNAHSATIDTRLGRLNDVEASLSRRVGSSTPPEVAVLLNQAQAFNYCRRREFERACDCFGAVDKVRPFDAGNLLHWGEALRRLGRLSEAVGKFQQALLRLPVAAPNLEGERAYVAFKARLSQVELGRDANFKAELDEHLGMPAPDGYWLLTGAAVALQRNDLPAAIELLKKAQAVFSPTQFASLLEDYFFRAFAYHPEMNAFLSSPSPEHLEERRLRMDYFVDP